MNTKVVVVAAIVVAVIIVGGVVFFLSLQGRESKTVPGGVVGQFQIQQPTPQVQYQATANIDDAVSAVLGDALVDETPAAEDPTLLSEDDQALSETGESLDTAQF